MKLYIWNESGVLEDYTHGMICALGEDLEQALGAIEAACNCCMNSFPNHRPTEVIDLGPAAVEPKAWVCYGGR